MEAIYHAFQHWMLCACLAGLGMIAALVFLAKVAAPAWDAVRRWWSLPCIQRVIVGVCVVGLSYYGATKQGWHVGYDGGIKAGATANVVTNDTVSIHWQRDTSGGVYVPETAVVYIDAIEHGGSNVVNIAQTTVGAWGWSGTVENATNYDYIAWAYYIPPEPVHTNGVWTYKTHFDRSGEYALPLRARVEVNGVAIATPAEKRKDAVPTARDYIQDGLIAMWDGIERGDNPLVWSDITGNGWDLTVTSGSEWLTDALSCSGYQRFGIASMPNRLIPAASVEHVEITCFVTKRQNNPLIFYNGASRLKDAKNIVITASTVGVETSENKRHTACKLTTGLFRISATWEKLYIDGERVTDTTFSSDSWLGGSESFALFGRSCDSNYAAAGRVYCVRIYSRALSADEIRHNYEIDKERFNLP